MKTKIKLFFFLLTFSQLACECESIECKDRCSQVPETGPCEALFYKFYYNKTTKSCETFTWGGCAGVVPFETKEECESCGCK